MRINHAGVTAHYEFHSIEEWTDSIEASIDRVKYNEASVRLQANTSVGGVVWLDADRAELLAGKLLEFVATIRGGAA